MPLRNLCAPVFACAGLIFASKVNCGGLRERQGRTVAVRIGDTLVVIECFSYELPLDYEVGKPSIFETRKRFIMEKLSQARTLVERLKKSPRGTNFDVTWAKKIDWRVVSPFVEFAWDINEPFFDQDGLPRLFQARELMDNLAEGRIPAADCVPLLKAIRNMTLKGVWY